MRVDLGICWGVPDKPVEEGLETLKKVGFDGIELWPVELWRHGAQAWANALNSAGLRCFQLCPYFNFVSGEKAIADSYKQLEQFVGAARILKCGRLRVFTGPPWGEGVVGSREATPSQWESAISHLQKFCDIANLDGIELCLECHDGSLMDDSNGALRLLQGVARKNLSINLQLPFVGEAWHVSVDRLAAYTRHIHIHNWTESLGVGNITFLDAGRFNWFPVLERLEERGCESVCLSVEHITHDGRDSAMDTARRDGPFLTLMRERFLNLVGPLPVLP